MTLESLILPRDEPLTEEPLSEQPLIQERRQPDPAALKPRPVRRPALKVQPTPRALPESDPPREALGALPAPASELPAAPASEAPPPPLQESPAAIAWEAPAAPAWEAPATPTKRQRSATYRGTSRQAAEAAYHADARVMVRMGYAPVTESFSTVLEHVIKVQYEEAPELAPSVIDALEAADAEAAAGAIPPVPRPALRTRLAALYASLPLALRIGLGSLAGIVLGIGLCFAAATESGRPPDIVSLLGFATIGLLFGAFGAIRID